MNDNALNWNFWWQPVAGTGDIVRSRGDITAASASNLLQPSQTIIHLKTSLPYLLYMATQCRSYTMRLIQNPNGQEITGLLGRLAVIVPPGVARKHYSGDRAAIAWTDADKSKVIVSAVNPEVPNCHVSIRVNSDGTVTITYKDSTTNVVAVKTCQIAIIVSLSQTVRVSTKTSAPTVVLGMEANYRA